MAQMVRPVRYVHTFIYMGVISADNRRQSRTVVSLDFQNLDVQR